MRLAPYQKQFIRGLLAPDTDVGIWTLARGNAKSATMAALAATHLLGEWGAQPQREIPLAARTRDQAAIAWGFVRSFLEAMPEIAPRLTVRAAPILEIEFEAEDGPHRLKAMPSTGKAALGGAATFAVLDERAAWMDSRGAELEAAILTSLGKRNGKAAIISTAAPNDQNAFSQWCDNPPEGAYVQVHAAEPGHPADELEGILAANPGTPHGIGPDLKWLQRAARQAMRRGGPALAAFKNLHRNERTSIEAREVLIDFDRWQACEVEELPPREGPVLIGLDAGGPASMTAAAYFWPASGRFEAAGWFPTIPSLADRGAADGVGERYEEMARRGELRQIGGRTVPVSAWAGEVLAHVEGCEVGGILADRFRQSELADGLDAAGCRVPVTWRGFGWRDGSADIQLFRRMVLDGRVKARPSLLMRSALSDAVVVSDDAGNVKLSKARSMGRIDAAAAAVLCIAEGQRRLARPVRASRGLIWA